ncbi:hypothetical protein AAFF_G00279730 [Aldrovandia affinis]|uniref:Uncharacterized protein n=1 Tax=Aldrovandia affinis TaxID=143900 RepID=A0AAD7WT53_9TELE|nr:hypothetical protein AAFF_G00279730 [Aldrovandia affinis]
MPKANPKLYCDHYCNPCQETRTNRRISGTSRRSLEREVGGCRKAEGHREAVAAYVAANRRDRRLPRGTVERRGPKEKPGDTGLEHSQETPENIATDCHSQAASADSWAKMEQATLGVGTANGLPRSEEEEDVPVPTEQKEEGLPCEQVQQAPRKSVRMVSPDPQRDYVCSPEPQEYEISLHVKVHHVSTRGPRLTPAYFDSDSRIDRFGDGVGLCYQGNQLICRTRCSSRLMGSSAGLEKALLKSLRQLDEYLLPEETNEDSTTDPGESTRSFLGEAELILSDCNLLTKLHIMKVLHCPLLPKPHIIKVVARKYRNFDIPVDMAGVWRYLHSAYQREESANTRPWPTARSSSLTLRNVGEKIT